MNINNIYMFKNPIRHFIDINDFEYSIDGNDVVDISNLSWTRSADFVIRRHYYNNDLRILKLPNILNFYNLYKVSSVTENFYQINDISQYSKYQLT